MKQIRCRRLTRAALAFGIAALLLLPGCRREAEDGAVAADPDAVQVILDGEARTGASVSPESGDALRVYITLDGEALIDLPFGEAHTVTVVQPNGDENTCVLTGERVFMERANCENQDCVQMGEVTRENLELRVMGGFIICLPHRISVEVRGG